MTIVFSTVGLYVVPNAREGNKVGVIVGRIEGEIVGDLEG